MGGKRKGIPRRAADGWEMKKKIMEKNDFRDWAGLHDYLLEKVIGRLPIADCLSFGSVCKPWGIIAANFLVKCDRDVPCFVKRGQNEVTIRSCFSVVVNSEFKLELPKAYERCIIGSFQDWLFLAKKKEKCRLETSLLNPFTGENITLPEVPSIFFLMVISAVPSDEKCVCMLVNHGHIAFWIPGARKWHEVWVGPYNFLDALYYSGCFYLLDDASTRVVIIDEKNVLSMLNTGATKVLTQSLSVKLPGESERARYYLVESRGEILLVTRSFYADGARRGETSAFEIFKLDLCKMAWLKLENLDDDQILFVGSGCSKSFYVEDLGGSFANRVYFINQGQSSHMTEWDMSFKDYRCRNYIDDWGFFSFQRQNQWPTVFQAIPNRWGGVWLSAPIGWCLKQMRR